MEIKFDVYFKKNLGTLFKSNEVDLDGIPAHTNLDLNLVDRLEANYRVGTQKYTDNVSVFSIEERVIQIPFKSDVVRVGLNEFEIIAYMKNGDIKTSQTYTYNIDEAIGEGQHPSNSGDIDLANYATKSYVDNAISKIQLTPGPKGDKGDKGDIGPQGPAGASYNDTELRSLISELTRRIEELESGYVPPVEDENKPVEAKAYCGQMNFKSIDNIAIEDLEALVNIVDVIKPQTTYSHSGSTVYNKTLICAIPKSKGVISSVVDGAGVDITASYPIIEKTLNGVVYSISCNKVAQAYNKSTVVKFNIN